MKQQYLDPDLQYRRATSEARSPLSPSIYHRNLSGPSEARAISTVPTVKRRGGSRGGTSVSTVQYRRRNEIVPVAGGAVPVDGTAVPVAGSSMADSVSSGRALSEPWLSSCECCFTGAKGAWLLSELCLSPGRAGLSPSEPQRASYVSHYVSHRGYDYICVISVLYSSTVYSIVLYTVLI